MKLKHNYYLKHLSVILIGYFSILIIIKYLILNQIPGYGGDQVSLYDAFVDKSTLITPFKGIGIADYFIKTCLSYLEAPQASVLILFLFPFLINFLAAAGSLSILSKMLDLNPLQRTLIFILIWLQPLGLSLMLSGHHTFTPALVLYTSLLSRRSVTYSLASTIIIFFINPYLSFGFIIVSAGIDLLTKNSHRSKFFILCLLLIISRGLADTYFKVDYMNLIKTDLSQRVRGEGSGIYPLNWIMPDINSFAGYFFREFKNTHYQYLNVPESNYSVLMPLALLLCVSPSMPLLHAIKILLLWCALNTLLTFPPHTDRFGGIYFPSYVLNLLIPELRVLSRFSVFLDYIFIIYLLSKYFNKSKFKGVIPPLILAVSLPLNIPFYDLSKMTPEKCLALPTRYSQSNDYWSMYYSKHFDGRPMHVFPFFNSDGILKFCEYANNSPGTNQIDTSNASK